MLICDSHPVTGRMRVVLPSFYGAAGRYDEVVPGAVMPISNPTPEEVIDVVNASARPLKVGLLLPETEGQMNGATARWSDLLAMTQAAEAIGFDSCG